MQIGRASKSLVQHFERKLSDSGNTPVGDDFIVFSLMFFMGFVRHRQTCEMT